MLFFPLTEKLYTLQYEAFISYVLLQIKRCIQDADNRIIQHMLQNLGIRYCLVSPSSILCPNITFF
jgi:hypothetical protein